MPHPRDLKIAKLIQQCVGQFFHEINDEIMITIENVEMSSRKSAEIYYKLSHMQSNDVETIIATHENILKAMPKIKKFIADNINLKAIPKLHFHLQVDPE